MTAALLTGRARDLARVDEMQREILRHELLLEHAVARIRAALDSGSRPELEQLEEDLARAIAVGPPELPKPRMDGVELEQLKEQHVRYRIFVEELATKGVEMGGTGAALRACEILGWPAVLRR